VRLSRHSFLGYQCPHHDVDLTHPTQLSWINTWLDLIYGSEAKVLSVEVLAQAARPRSLHSITPSLPFHATPLLAFPPFCLCV
jgi:hypothetical protein